MARDDIERKLAAAETNLEEAAARLQRTQQRLAELDDERAAILGETEIARRALADLEGEIAKSREALAALEVEEARAAVGEAVARRDRLLADAAAALDAAVDLLEQIDAHRVAVTEARERLLRLAPDAARGAVPEEPDVLHEPWQRMVFAVKAQLDEELEVDLVEAAARSHSPAAINALPEHLRDLALQRRRQLQRASLDRAYEARRS